MDGQQQSLAFLKMLTPEAAEDVLARMKPGVAEKLRESLTAEAEVPIDAGRRAIRRFDEMLALLHKSGAPLTQMLGQPGLKIAEEHDAAEAEATEPQLRALYAESPALFSGAGRYQVSQIFLRSGTDLEDRVAAVTGELAAGTAFSVVKDRFGDPATIALPSSALPANKLREYTGPSAIAAITSLDPGAHTGPVPVPGGVAVFKLLASEPGTPRPFDQVRGLVAAEYVRRRDDTALRTYLDWLWQRADIEPTEGFTAQPESFK